MAITVNTNISALNIQSNLSKATAAMNKAMVRMSTGSKINSASDDAAGLAVSTSFEKTISSSKVASQNVQIGSNLLTTTEGTLGVIKSNLQRIRDLAEQSANGTYSTTDRNAMKQEAQQRAAEIDRLATSTKFNGINLLCADNQTTSGIAIQVGTESGTGDSITISASVFDHANVSMIGLGNSTAIGNAFNTAAASKTFLTSCDNAMTNITNRQTSIGAFQNRLSAASENLVVQRTNLTAANSTIKDADVAEESANYVQAQILQQASAALLASANQAPSIALTLING